MTYLFEDYSLDTERRELRRGTDLISVRAPRNLPGGGRAGNPGFFDREHGIFSSWPQVGGGLSMDGC